MKTKLLDSVLRHNLCKLIMHYAKKNLVFIFKSSGDNLISCNSVLEIFNDSFYPIHLHHNTNVFVIISFSHVSLLFFRLFLIKEEFHCSSHHFCSSVFLVLYFRSEKRTKQWEWKINIVLYMFFTPLLILNIISVQFLVGC